MQKLPREFYAQDTLAVARALLGAHLIHRHEGVEKIGKIVEVEAYVGAHDLACHAAKGRTPRTEIMFGPPGFAYVYLIYGMYHCLNVVTEAENKAAAVLIRALEPLVPSTLRTQGPGLLCRAMGITRAQNGHDFLSDALFIAAGDRVREEEVVVRPRIGVDYAKEWAKAPFRFYIKGNRFVSKK